MKDARVLSRGTSSPGADQFVIHVPEKYCGHEYILASAVEVYGSGPEVYLFPCDKEGLVLHWLELAGSQRGTLNVGQVLIDAGLRIVEFDQSLLN